MARIVQKNKPAAHHVTKHKTRRVHAFMIAMFFILLGILLLYKFSILDFDESASAPSADALYRQASAPVDARVEDLLSRMTLEEKLGQMALVEKNSVDDASDIAAYGLGALLSGAGAKPNDNTGEGWRSMVTHFTALSKKSRLGIPILYGADAVHGHGNVPGATIFPHSIGLGATRDAGLVERVARATAEELNATGIYWSYSPNLDLPQDIRWGRTYEAFSDDPAVAAPLGAAYVRGLQVGNASGTNVLATAKHYIGAGGMQWRSSSNKNFKIDQGTTPPDEKILRSTYLPPFKAAVDAGVGSVMVGLNSWGDTKLSAQKYLITDVLKGELGFKGFVVSDWYSVYEIPGGDYKAAVIAINAGVDMVMLPFDYKPFIANMLFAVRVGDLDESRVDDAVRRILRAKFTAGLFDRTEPTADGLSTLGSTVHRALAREAVAKSSVLLKNSGAVLPIKKNVTRITVAGSAADNVGRQMGAWSVEWQGVDGNWVPGGTSILAGIKERAGSGTNVEYEKDGNFAKNAPLADIGIAVVGEKPYAEGWGDTEYPMLSAEDRAVITHLKASSKKVVVVIVSGRPLLIEHELGTMDALVAVWLPGSEGGGVADVLFGVKSFTGKLPLPWPLDSEEIPIAPDGTTADGTAPLFPRGFGLR